MLEDCRDEHAHPAPVIADGAAFRVAGDSDALREDMAPSARVCWASGVCRLEGEALARLAGEKGDERAARDPAGDQGDGRAGSLPARGLQRALDEHARPSRRARRAGAHAGRAALLRPHRRAGPLSVRAGRENTLREIAPVRGVMCRRAREGAGADEARPRRRLRARSSGGSCGARSRCGTSSSPTSARAALRRGAGGWRP